MKLASSLDGSSLPSCLNDSDLFGLLAERVASILQRPKEDALSLPSEIQLDQEPLQTVNMKLGISVTGFGHDIAYTKLSFRKGSWQQLLDLVIDTALARYKVGSCIIPRNQLKLYCIDQHEHHIPVSTADDLELAHMDTNGHLLKLNAMHTCQCYILDGEPRNVSYENKRDSCEGCGYATCDSGASSRSLQFRVVTVGSGLCSNRQTLTLCHDCLPESANESTETWLITKDKEGTLLRLHKSGE